MILCRVVLCSLEWLTVRVVCVSGKSDSDSI